MSMIKEKKDKKVDLIEKIVVLVVFFHAKICRTKTKKYKQIFIPRKNAYKNIKILFI